jgi:hypothetical protein
LLRRTDLTLADLAPERSPTPVRDWTATFTLAWADQRHRLQVVVPAAGRAEAEARAWRAMADHLRGLADRALQGAARAGQAGVGLEGLPKGRLRLTEG